MSEKINVNRIGKFYFLFKRLFWSELWYNTRKAHDKWISNNDSFSNKDKQILHFLLRTVPTHITQRAGSFHFRGRLKRPTDTSELKNCLKKPNFCTNYQILHFHSLFSSPGSSSKSSKRAERVDSNNWTGWEC